MWVGPSSDTVCQIQKHSHSNAFCLYLHFALTHVFPYPNKKPRHKTHVNKWALQGCKAVASGGAALDSITLNVFVIFCLPLFYYKAYSAASVVLHSEWQQMSYFSLSKLYSYWAASLNTLVSISHNPDSVKTRCALCTNISACLCMFVLMLVSEWRIFEEVSTRCRTTMVCSILKNTWNCFPSCLPSIIAVDSDALSKSHTLQPTAVEDRCPAQVC